MRVRQETTQRRDAARRHRDEKIEVEDGDGVNNTNHSEKMA
jgi:hypothetical protein